MDTVIIFSNEKEKNHAQTLITLKDPTLFRNIACDYMENGTLKNIEEWATCEELPDFIFYGRDINQIGIFSAMPKEYRRDYFTDKDEGGFYIAKADGRFSSIDDFMEKVGTLYPDSLSIWTPPKMIPINNSVITMQTETEPTPIIDGLLGSGESLLISGSAGIGKSLLVNYLAYALANQDNLWGKFKIPKPVISLVLQSEVDLFAQKNRLVKLLSANPDFKSDMVFSLGSSRDSGCQVVGSLTNEAFQTEITRAITETKAEVLFVDPLISFNPANENDNTQMRKVLDSFMNAVKGTGISVVFTHHMNKTGGTRGASAIRDWTANALELRLDKLENGEARIEVVHDKARNFEQANPFYLRRTKNLSFEAMQDNLNNTDLEKVQCVIDALVNVGGEIEGQLTFAKLIGENGMGTRTALKKIKDAVYFGLIFENKIGPGMPSIYTLPS